MANEKVNFIWNHTVKEIHEKDGKVGGLTLVSTVNGAEQEFKSDGTTLCRGIKGRIKDKTNQINIIYMASLFVIVMEGIQWLKLHMLQ